MKARNSNLVVCNITSVLWMQSASRDFDYMCSYSSLQCIWVMCLEQTWMHIIIWLFTGTALNIEWILYMTVLNTGFLIQSCMHVSHVFFLYKEEPFRKAALFFCSTLPSTAVTCNMSTTKKCNIVDCVYRGLHLGVVWTFLAEWLGSYGEEFRVWVVTGSNPVWGENSCSDMICNPCMCFLGVNLSKYPCFSGVVSDVVFWLLNTLWTCALYFRGRSPKTILGTATLIKKLQIKYAILPSHSIPTLGQSVPALTLQCQAAGEVAAKVTLNFLLENFNVQSSVL